MGIATKKGDNGTTNLLGKERIQKDDERIEALGELDELISSIGLARSGRGKDDAIGALLRLIQGDLGKICAAIATNNNSDLTGPLTLIEDEIRRLEQDRAAADSFVVPGDKREGAALHLSRSVCRRAERRLVTLNKTFPLPSSVLPYINRLSDLLFLLAEE